MTQTTNEAFHPARISNSPAVPFATGANASAAPSVATQGQKAPSSTRPPEPGAETIAGIVERFVDGFNTNDLDAVMDFFADDAVYQPGDGREFRGRAAIRKELRAQFEQAYGTMRFIVDDRVIDERARKATIRWLCQHDFATAKPFFQKWFFMALYGRRAGWYGTDTFHFDARGDITGKFSYANYGKRPQVRRDLGGK